ncbi:glycoside hydrolase family 39 domain protein [Teredinibacter turnerae T7901]|uniref:Glycoside hydrolase family 39 domain protein n=1 Tax=Teredinibacter turnerae (strain ATCC 39867 / T7901) TaxID=377629 RepID=C6AR15_TERTT|nr:glycoside hydrolase family 39 [Teredinibacter turnerae]ACS93559.1 glycoside hydrolase family 39 domain protein [Teredinibacter turnerae T7901]
MLFIPTKSSSILKAVVSIGLLFVIGCNNSKQLSGEDVVTDDHFERKTLYVDLGNAIKPVTHVASGALYGVVENIPTNIDGLVAPLNPSSYVQPALSGEGAQQPYGSAIAVSKRLWKVTKAKVAIRLADVHPGWPYQWSGWNNWEKKVREVITAKQRSGRTNYYGYEIWNEPKGTWQAQNGNFLTTVWKPTYDLLRKLDPLSKIIGPSSAYYAESQMEEFLRFCKANDCMPDIVSWHQLQGSQTIANNITNYRALENRLQITPRLISINEYSHDNHVFEGAPGVAVPFIAKFERHGVDTANISWWFPALPGRLGSLITAEGARNGGWWLYKWYGEMSGEMVTTTPPNEASDGLDGFASLDMKNQRASIIVGGNFLGIADVKISGIPTSFADRIRVKVEHVTWSSKESPVNGTVVDSDSVYSIQTGTLTVPVKMTNPLWGYRISLSREDSP